MLSESDIKMAYKDLPDCLLNSSHSLIGLGVCSVCWDFCDTLKVLSFLRKNNFVILGGDVIILKDNKYEFTYDSWFVKPIKYEPHKIYVVRSYIKALMYIHKYVEDNGTDYYFTISYKNR